MVTDRHLLVSFRDAGRGFLIAMRAPGRYTPGYLERLEDSLRLAADYAESAGWPDVTAITPGHVEGYLSHLRTRGRQARGEGPISGSYVATNYRRLYRFFGWLKQRGHLARNPLEVVERPFVPEPDVLPLSDDEQAALIAFSDPRIYRAPGDHWRAVRNRAALFLFIDTPGRLAEIAGLELDDIDQSTGEIHVLGKGRKQRWMPIGESAQDALQDWLIARAEVVHDRHPALWVDHHSHPVGREWLYLMLHRLAKRAGLEGFHPHRLRHNFTIRAVKAGVPTALLEDWGGWKRIPKTYLNGLTRADLREAHRDASPLDRATASVARARRRL